ncbi:unnamed protein product [Protopolystoma xenopodis]|uniref:Uncharacterized protein n=1 Tax=Protopolystoma xenopodis TaxID=117903 RepID=A0A3S5BWX9_9PLAT|nr:unnamed protein product [Protopolystoma xenopodis]
MESPFFDFVIVGGGIAGVVCAETLCQLIRPSIYSGLISCCSSAPALTNCSKGSPNNFDGEKMRYQHSVCLISASASIKAAINIRRI